MYSTTAKIKCDCCGFIAERPCEMTTSKADVFNDWLFLSVTKSGYKTANVDLCPKCAKDRIGFIFN